MHQTSEKLALVRTLMEERGVDAYVIPDTDPHLGEYIPEHWQIIKWLSGFTGSAGTIVVTAEFAGLWTDSRYFLQAEKQLSGSEITLVRTDLTENPGFIQWLSKSLQSHSRIGVNGQVLSVSMFRKLKRMADEKKIVIDIECDLISPLWSDRPSLSREQAFDHPVSFSGIDRNQKLTRVRDEMVKQNVEFHLLTSPDDIMWLLNIRGKDIKHSPLLMSFAIIGMEQVLLFADEEKIPFIIAREFDKLGIVILPYEEAAGMLSTLRSGSGILISPASTSAALYSSIPGRLKVKEDVSIPARLKAVKNSTEISNLSGTMIRDGVALTKFFFGIERDKDLIPMSELSLTARIDHLRSLQENYLTTSFPTIVAYNEHAALPHYTATSETDTVISDDCILLVDSGGQYLDGTTDITRTICLGKPTGKQKADFTFVLKGMISLAQAVFPSGTYGHQLDILARKYLWEHGLNYGHGTGHGVGYCLNVHEGPHRISIKSGNDPSNIIAPGILVSDEPAVYREGEYGIRTENMLLCYEDEETEFGKFNRFITISLCYIDKSLIDFSLLDRNEITWLNKYHSEVFEKLSPFLEQDEREWLRLKTQEAGVL
ncbi:MAG TPA: aminopeptidase P family protein [Bacteroidales bacterium]|nr:aminopeptidase P family protein [Bacteroidales bacterium]